jgi:hypothetical protein
MEKLLMPFFWADYVSKWENKTELPARFLRNKYTTLIGLLES